MEGNFWEVSQERDDGTAADWFRGQNDRIIVHERTVDWIADVDLTSSSFPFSQARLV